MKIFSIYPRVCFLPEVSRWFKLLSGIEPARLEVYGDHVTTLSGGTFKFPVIREIPACGEQMPKRPRLLKKIRTTRDLKGEVYKIIREGITSGALEPGARLKETELVEDLGVSRTPIREALNQLSRENLVEIIPRKGALVKPWTKKDALEVLVLRETLEGLAGRLAASKMTDEEIDSLEALMDDFGSGSLEYVEADKRFHEGIVNACGMERLKDLVRNLYDSLQMRKMLALSFNSRKRIRESMEEHRRIIKALRARDEDAVEKAVRSNFQKTRAMLKRMKME